MSITLGLPAIVAVLGALVYGLSANPKVAELGRLAFGCGLLAFLIAFRYR